MSEENAVLYSVDNHVALISLNRPKKLNTSSRALRADLGKAIKAAEADDDVRVVVFTGEGRAFAAGADLNESFTDDHNTVTEHLHKDHKPLIDAIRAAKKPFIAALHGATAGVNIAYALACDLIIMSENAFLLSPFSNIGLIPDGGTSWFLMSRLGRHRAYQMIIESDRLTSAQCLEYGIANKVVPDDGLRNAALDWANALAHDRPPLVMRYAKQVLNNIEDNAYNNAFDIEAKLQNSCVTSNDAREGISAFLEKRKATFTGT